MAPRSTAKKAAPRRAAAPAKKAAAREARTPGQELEALSAATPSVGDEHPTVDVRDQTFTLRWGDEVPAIVHMRLAAASGDRVGVPEQMGAIYEYLTEVADPDEADEFLHALRGSPDEPIGFEELNDIMTAAAEAMSARPTE